MSVLNQEKIKEKIEILNHENSLDLSEFEEFQVEVGLIDFNDDPTTWFDSVTLDIIAEDVKLAKDIALGVVNNYLESNGYSYITEVQ